MTERPSNNDTKIAILLLAPVLAAIALFALRPSEDKPVEQPKVVVVEKPVEQPPPAPPPVVASEAAAKEMDQARETLLGLNKPEPKPEVVEPRQEAASRTVTSVKKKRTTREETSEVVEDLYPERKEQLASGGLSDLKFRETIEAWRGMRNCVETSKARTDQTSGALRMSLKITGSGEVLGGKVFAESNDAARKVGRCVEKQLASLKFPAFETQQAMIVKEAKFVF